MATIALTVKQNGTPDLRSFLGLATVSLAPLIAHIFVGTPRFVYMIDHSPGVLSRIVFFNPTTILWRYFAIFDRRIRAKHWDRETVAALNTLFWTDRGWEEGEDMLRERRTVLIRRPAHTHINPVSSSSLSTLIVALQGLQALLQFSKLNSRFLSTYNTMAVIFSPLAIVGLIRLFAAFYLLSTEDYEFANMNDSILPGHHDDETGSPSPSSGSSGLHKRRHTHASSDGDQIKATDVELESLQSGQELDSKDRKQAAEAQIEVTATSQSAGPGIPLKDARSQLYSASSWRGILSRALFLICILGITALAIIWLFTSVTAKGRQISATRLVMLITYTFFTLATSFLFIWGMCVKRSSSTLLPGMFSWWFTAYSFCLYILFVLLFVVSAIEQSQTFCDGGSGSNCQNLLTLDNARVAFNTSSQTRGSINATHLLIMGKYTGFLLGQNSTGSAFNRTIGG